MKIAKIGDQIASVANELDGIGCATAADALDSILEKLASDAPKVYDLKRGAYAAIVLDESSRESLLSWWESEVGLPLHGNVVAHHMTIRFQPSAEELSAMPIGESAELVVVGWGADSKGQAVKVESGVPSSNAIPHITVALSPGTKPVYSNELLRSNINFVNGPTLVGVVKYVVP